MTGTDDRPVVRARGVGDLVSAVPHLLGHVPARSLVVVGLRGPRERIGICARIDLPEDPRGGPAGLASSLVGPLLRDGCDGAVIVVVSQEQWGAAACADRDRPWARLVRGVRATFAQAGIDVAGAVHTDLRRWWSYDCSRPCCPAEGAEVDPCSPLSTALVAEGSAPPTSREAVGEALRTPPPADVVEATAAAARHRAAGADAAGQACARGEAVAAVLRAVLDRARGEALLSPGEAGRLAASLADVVVRDAVLALLCDDLAASLVGGVLAAVDDGFDDGYDDGLDDGMGGLDDGLGGLDDGLGGLDDGLGATVAALVAAERALSSELADLVRGHGVDVADLDHGTDLRPPLVPWVPEALRRLVHTAAEVVLGRLAATVDGPLAAPAAGALAYLAWHRGHGVLARMAAERALAVDPAHSMALLVTQALDHAVPPPFAQADSVRDRAAG